MATVKREGSLDVVTAARIRLINIWQSAPKVYFAFSAGKDSLCLASLIYDLILVGKLDKTKLTVIFIDEEGLYKSMVENAETWREKFTKIGVPFNWYCLPFKQVCTLDTLSASESWITWDSKEKDKWMRQPPPYAIMYHSALTYAGEMNYQTFVEKIGADGIILTGLRVNESITRYNNFAVSKKNVFVNGKFAPIYDWTNNDVWLYIKDHNLKFPEIYMHLYENGVNKNMLRLSAFFGDKTTQGLRWVAQTDPDFWERIERRMPNAYLVLLYWDSAMFARNSKKRTSFEKNLSDDTNYKKLYFDIIKNPDKHNVNYDTKRTLRDWYRLGIRFGEYMTEEDWKKGCECIMNGDPKTRDLRAFGVRMQQKVGY